MKHTLAFEAQPIADQWMGRCLCGWQKAVSFNSGKCRTAVLHEIQEAWTGHIKLDTPPHSPIG